MSKSSVLKLLAVLALAFAALLGFRLLLTKPQVGTTATKKPPSHDASHPSEPHAILASTNRSSCETGTCGHDHYNPPKTAAQQPARLVNLPIDFPARITNGQKVNFELPDGRRIACEEARVESDENGVFYVSGTFTDPKPGSFFFRRQDFEGVAGKMIGHVIFDGEEMAWKVLPEGPNGDPVLKEVSIHEVVCVNYSPIPEGEAIGEPEEMPQDHPSTVALPEYQDVIPLESLPGAPGVIYLDFDGSKGPHDVWSYKGDAAHSGLGNSTIRDIWIRVAEDFLPFNINVTTDAKVYENATRGRRIRCIITPTNWYKAGGVAYIGSYNWGGDPVCWASNYTGDSAVTVISHEVGHTLGLYHHGYNGAEYYGGHGSGATAWAPIMGSGYGKTLKHWSDGSYYLATRPGQKDLTTITNQNGVDFRPDDCGATLASARYLWVAPGNTVTNQQGLIETTGDVDAFRFKTTGGAVNLTASTATIGINLDIRADIVNTATNAVVFTSDSTGSANATVSTTLAAGEYLLRITGATVGTPATSRGGYTNYGCLGSYRIDGTVTGGETHQAFTINEHSTNGAVIGTITPRTVTGSPLGYVIASGNTGNILAINASTGALTVANSANLNFETLSSRFDVPAQFELFVTITNNSNSTSETVRAIVTVNDLNEAPVLAAVSDARIPERTASGTQVVELNATDPDRFDGPVYEIVSGNTAGHFAINPRTGWITVANAPSVTTDTPVTLTVRARDQKTPTQYSVNRTITITFFNLPDDFTGTPGGLYRTFFRNISGAAVTDLTGNANFPNNPSDQVHLEAFDGGSNQGDNYGSTIRGYLIPPATGNYQFWISGDNGAQLILGADDAPAATPVIASVATSGEYAWDQQTSQASALIPLAAGQIYYIEARHKESNYGDHLAVAWSGPGISRRVILGTYLAPFHQNYAPKPSGTFNLMETAAAGTVVGTVSVADVNTEDDHDSFAITAGDPTGLFAINPTTGQITVATAGQFNAVNKAFYDLTVSTTDDGTPPLTGTGTVRVNILPSRLYFDPNGTAPGSVADGGSYGWRTTSWAATEGGTAAVASWIPNSQAHFAATTPPGTLAYDVDIAGYNSGTHGGFGAIRALGGTVRFVGNVDNFYLIGNTAVEAAPGSAIEFNQTRSGNSLLAFNLNFQTVTFDGNVSFNNGGMGNSGSVVVNSGRLELNAANLYTGSTTMNGGTLSLPGSGALYTNLNWANQTITLNPGTTLELDDWVGTNRSLGQLGYAAQNLIIDGATLRYTGPSNPIETNNGPGFTIGANGATLESASAGQMWRILNDSRNSTYGIVSNGGPLTLTGAGDGSITKVISGTETALIKTGSGSWHLGAANTYGGGTTVSEGTLQCNNSASLPGAVTILTDSTDETRFGTLFMNVGNTTWSQTVSGSGLWKVATGSGSQTTSLTGDYSGFNGTLEVATGSGKIQLASAAKYPAAGSTIQTSANTSVYLTGGGTLQSDIRLFGGSIGEPAYGQLRVGVSATLNGDITLHGNTTIAVDSSRTGTIHGVITESGGSFGFSKNQPGTLLLSANNTYTGGTTVNVGILRTNTGSGNFGPGNLTVANGATCQIRHTNGALGRHAYVYLNGTGKLDLATGVTETVARLYLNGVQQVPGTYNKTNLAANITGNGSLVVGEIAPFAPTNVTASLAAWNAVLLSWSHPAVNEIDLRIERSLSPHSGFAEIATLAPGTMGFLDTGRPANTTCFYRLRVSNALGFSPYSEVVSITTGTVDAPAGLTATASTGQVRLSWTNNPDATGYHIKRATVSGGPYTQIGGTASTTYNDAAVTNGVEYFYIVTATAAGFESQPSDEVSARPLPAPGNGIWTADSGGNWSNAENWQNFVVADGAGNSATFGQTGGGTVTLDTTGRTLGSLAFSNGTYELAGNPLTLDAASGAPVVSVGTGITATFAVSLLGTEGLEKTGGGRLILSTDSAVTGATTVTGGTLTHKGHHASSSFDIASGAVFEIDSSAGGMNLASTTFTGAGTLRKSGANRIYWGSTVGTFALGSGSLIDVPAGTLTGGSNANEVWTNNKSDLNIAGGAVFDGVEANVRVDGISGSGALKTGYSGAGYTNLTIGVDNGSSTFSGVIANSSSTGHLYKDGTGTITLAGNNTFTGNVTINHGILRITRSAGLGSGTKTVTINSGNNKSLELDGSGGNISVASSITYQTSGANGVIRNIAGDNTLAGAITMTAGNGNTRITSDGGALTLSGGISANTTGRVLDLGGSSTGNNTISGVISASNAPALTKNGPGTWILTGNQAYTGSTTVSEGTLTLAANRTASLGGPVAVGNTADQTATLNIQGDLPFAGQEFGVGSTAGGATGIVNHSAGLVSFSSGNALLIGRSTGGVSGTYHLSGGELRTYASTSRGVMIGVNDGASGNPIQATFLLSGTGFLNNATGSLQVVRGDSTSSYQDSTYQQTGGTSSNGTLVIGGNSANGANSAATFIVTGGTFSAATFGNLSRGNNVTSTLTIGGSADVTLPAFPTTRGTSSTATLTFDGGTLRPATTSTAYLGGLTNAWIRSGGVTLDVPTGRDITITQLLQAHVSSPGGSLTKSGPGVLTLSAANTYTGPTVVNGGSLVANTAAKLGTSHLTVNTGATCDLRNTGGAIADTAHVYLNGTGKLIIASGVAETVARLYVNQVLQAAGTYTAASHPALVSGSGSLVVTTAVPVAPSALAATAVSHQTIDLTWTDNEVGETGYLVERSTNSGSGFSQIASLPANTTSYQDTGLPANTTRFYRVRAAGGTGNSGYSNEASATTLPPPPAAPTGLTAIAGGFAVSLEWNAVPAATGYRIKRSTTAGSGFTQVGSTTATNFIDAGLTAGVPVFYQIAAETSGSAGPDSGEVTATPLAFVQWDGSDIVTAGAQGGTGPWNTAALWWNGFTNAGWPASGLNNEAVFGGTAGTVTLEPAGLTANRLAFNTNGYLLQNGPLTLNGTSPAVFTATGVTAEISSTINGTAGLAKSGPGSLILSGSNNYGSTAVQQGLLQVNHGGSLGSPTGSVSLGTGAAGTPGNVGNLTIDTDATIGSLNVVSNTSDTTTPAHIAQLLIASGRTLTASGLSAGLASSAAGSTRTALQTGPAGSGGTLTANGNVIIGGTGTGGNTLTAVDLSGLSAFNLNASTGFMRIGYGALTKGTLTLATNNTINASSISVGETTNSGNSNQFSTLNLGSGLNVIQTNDLRIGFEKTAGVVQFAGAAGSVSITGTNGAGKAAITVGRATGASYQGVGTNSLLLAGHQAAVTASTVVAGRKGTGSSAGNITSLVTFDTGTFSADEIQLGVAASGNASTSAAGTFTLGTNSSSTGILTVNGEFILASNTNNTNAQTANGTFTINGGTANLFGPIRDESTTTVGTSNTTLTLDGGTLDMKGNPIGGDGTSGNLAIDTLNFRSGTLKNVSQINNGSTGLNKSTGGTLTLSGTHTYTGATTISAGILVLDGTITSHLSATGGTLAVQGEPAITGNLDIPSPGTFEAAPGVTLTVSGDVTLAGALELTVPPGPGLGDSFTLLEKASSGAISGTFSGKPEGATFKSGGLDWQITYAGGDGNDLVVTVVEALSAIETWRLTHFGTTANTGDAADSFDANHDGESNLLEFATGQNPHAASRASITLTKSSATSLVFTYVRSKSAVDAGYLFNIQSSDTLDAPSWTDHGPGTVMTEGPQQSVSSTLPEGSVGRRFVRLEITSP